MFIFSFSILIVGLYMYWGHKLDILTMRAAYQNLTKDEWKNIGKWTMISSIIPLILAIVGLFLDI